MKKIFLILIVLCVLSLSHSDPSIFDKVKYKIYKMFTSGKTDLGFSFGLTSILMNDDSLTYEELASGPFFIISQDKNINNKLFTVAVFIRTVPGQVRIIYCVTNINGSKLRNGVRLDTVEDKNLLLGWDLPTKNKVLNSASKTQALWITIFRQNSFFNKIRSASSDYVLSPDMTGIKKFAEEYLLRLDLQITDPKIPIFYYIKLRVNLTKDDPKQENIKHFSHLRDEVLKPSNTKV
ncbi:uncharacterized protein LOC142327998 [Lycorma delicatula]|uniref:uncharacterized protein LOC142327998 n=1 Tax=Lycorma delicatula TaxID=130591 RepID=UPI003F513173